MLRYDIHLFHIKYSSLFLYLVYQIHKTYYNTVYFRKKTFLGLFLKNGRLIQPTRPYEAYAVSKEKRRSLIWVSVSINAGFALIVVLFILLIIVGSAYIC